MSHHVHSRELGELSRSHEAGEDVLSKAMDLLRRIRDETASLPAAQGDPEQLRAKAKAIEEHVQLGALALPEGADQGLAEIAESARGRLATKALSEAFGKRLQVYLAKARETRKRAADLEAQLERTDAQVQVLEGYAALLDATIRVRGDALP